MPSPEDQQVSHFEPGHAVDAVPNNWRGIIRARNSAFAVDSLDQTRALASPRSLVEYQVVLQKVTEQHR